jgi:hypothetical protein
MALSLSFVINLTSQGLFQSNWAGSWELSSLRNHELVEVKWWWNFWTSLELLIIPPGWLNTPGSILWLGLCNLIQKSCCVTYNFTSSCLSWLHRMQQVKGCPSDFSLNVTSTEGPYLTTQSKLVTKSFYQITLLILYIACIAKWLFSWLLNSWCIYVFSPPII